MIERIKSMVLIILVLFSILLTWQLWNSQPNFEVLKTESYIAPPPTGKPKEITDVALPIQVIFHYGKERHTVSLPSMAQYRIVLEKMSGWYFDDFKQLYFSTDELKEIAQNELGLEIVYPTNYDTTLFPYLLNVKGEIPSFQGVNRIWIYYDAKEEVTYGLFLSKGSNMVIQARTVLTSADLQNFYLGLGNNLPSYQLYISGRNMLYLPNEPISIKRVWYKKDTISIDNMIDSLFIDPSLTRQIKERDGSIIYTDGNRALQYLDFNQSISYHNPLVDDTQNTDPKGKSFLDSIHFINRQGGWNGDYIISKISSDGFRGKNMVYREMVNSFLVYMKEPNPYGTISIQIKGNFISGYQRSLIRRGDYISHQTIDIATGEQLMDWLEKKGKREGIQEIYPAYLATFTDDNMIRFDPVWIIKYENNSTIYLDAELTRGEAEIGLE
ncbi:two-component system activity regulator YycH [Microaerobacter geothermalis]|uniref:YycH family regulatory protein n=1 Tax=Microaerobacter geothermalis TaxID=674972 RepID=UPI001F206670|nr:two-component system activity regulator YycH [Microaerobacter geothermalis]MCF6094649.1 two-component system activity regulator YycH [Microaerobacter geothermalis]